MDDISKPSRWNKIYLSSVPSTNDYALEKLKHNELRDKSVVYSFHQTHGKGQFGRKWLGEPNANIYLSMILDIEFIPLEQLFKFNMAMALAVKSFINNRTNREVSLKWPNDIYIAEKKIAGILIQNTVSGKILNNSVVGVGININQLSFPLILKNAISMSQITGQNYNLDILVDQFLQEVDQFYSLLRSGSFLTIDKNYQDSLYRLGKKTSFNSKERGSIEGVIEGVNRNGQLRVRIEKELCHFNHGEIEYVL